MVNKAIRVAHARAPVRLVYSIVTIYSAGICHARTCGFKHARACGFKHARACGLALVLTPTKGCEPLPGMAYTECDTLLSLSIMHSWYRRL